MFFYMFLMAEIWAYKSCWVVQPLILQKRNFRLYSYLGGEKDFRHPQSVPVIIMFVSEHGGIVSICFGSSDDGKGTFLAL